ncbi:hypothetical protein [Bacteroides neonati]|nr:hypothetical protein [Bacteroides neonati]
MAVKCTWLPPSSRFSLRYIAEGPSQQIKFVELVERPMKIQIVELVKIAK